MIFRETVLVKFLADSVFRTQGSLEAAYQASNISFFLFRHLSYITDHNGFKDFLIKCQNEEIQTFKCM